jgi:hypothetical protein
MKANGKIAPWSGAKSHGGVRRMARAADIEVRFAWAYSVGPGAACRLKR